MAHRPSIPHAVVVTCVQAEPAAVYSTPSVAPAQARVQCLLERRVGNRWVTVQRKRINVRGGSFQTKVRPKQAGLYRVSIVADGVVRRRTLRALH